MKVLAVVMLLCLPSLAHAKYEVYYQELWCDEWGGQAEVVLYDRTRVDCLLPDYAVEVKFAPRWAESIGQALYYAEVTNRRPAVLLIVRPGEHRFLRRWHNAADGLGIRLFTIDYEEE